MLYILAHLCRLKLNYCPRLMCIFCTLLFFICFQTDSLGVFRSEATRNPPCYIYTFGFTWFRVGTACSAVLCSGLPYKPLSVIRGGQIDFVRHPCRTTVFACHWWHSTDLEWHGWHSTQLVFGTIVYDVVCWRLHPIFRQALFDVSRWSS